MWEPALAPVRVPTAPGLRARGDGAGAARENRPRPGSSSRVDVSIHLAFARPHRWRFSACCDSLTMSPRELVGNVWIGSEGLRIGLDDRRRRIACDERRGFPSWRFCCPSWQPPRRLAAVSTESSRTRVESFPAHRENYEHQHPSDATAHDQQQRLFRGRPTQSWRLRGSRRAAGLQDLDAEWHLPRGRSDSHPDPDAGSRSGH
jgi:hypothetical protein